MVNLEKFKPVANEMQLLMQSVHNSENHFVKMFAISTATTQLKAIILRPEIIENIMSLQGIGNGFLTDSKTKEGYSKEVVANCIIEAGMLGLFPIGNQFNIIAGKMYVTKNGMKQMLENLSYLKNKKIIFGEIIMHEKSAEVKTTIEWHDTRNNTNNKEIMSFHVKTEQYSTLDNIQGKATRKARAWLYENVTGDVVSDGDAEDAVKIHIPINLIEPETEDAEVVIEKDIWQVAVEMNIGEVDDEEEMFVVVINNIQNIDTYNTIKNMFLYKISTNDVIKKAASEKFIKLTKKAPAQTPTK